MSRRAATLYGRWVVALVLSASAVPAFAQVSVTIFGGYAVSEGIDNTTTGEQASVKSGAAFGVAGDYVLDASRHLQLFYGQQKHHP